MSRNLNQVPPPAPNAGIFDPKNPPAPRTDGYQIYAVVVRDKNSQKLVAYYSRDVYMHVSVLHDNDMNAVGEEIIDGGYIVNGLYKSAEESDYSKNTSPSDRAAIESMVNRTFEVVRVSASDVIPHEVIPDRGKYNPENFPLKYQQRTVLAVKTSKGDIYWSGFALSHIDVINHNDLDNERIIEGGIIRDGIYEVAPTSMFTRGNKSRE